MPSQPYWHEVMRGIARMFPAIDQV